MSTPPRKTDNPRYVERARTAAKSRWEATAAERTERRINELVRSAPPLTDTQRAKLRALLGGA